MHYLDLPATDLGGFGWGINGHPVGHPSAKNQHNGSYTADWKIGVTKDFSGWVACRTSIRMPRAAARSLSWQPYRFTNSLQDERQGRRPQPGSGTAGCRRGVAVLSVSQLLIKTPTLTEAK